MSLPAPFYSDPVATLYCGDNRTVLPLLPDRSVHCCVTSPPYFGLRDYGHEGQIGLEQTPDAYVAELVKVFREVKRVLRDDGTLWLNLGDSYAAGRGGTAMPAETLAGGVNGHGDETSMRGRLAQVPDNKNPNATYQPHRNAGAIGLKHKDLIGIPWRVAFALQADGWYLRQDIIWHKPNPMPESVTDRCTKAHEYIFLLSKSERYCFDNEAIQEPSVDPKATEQRYRYEFNVGAKEANGAGRPDGASNTAGMKNLQYKGVPNHSFHERRAEGLPDEVSPVRNKRSVWTVPTKPFPGAHFAVFPPDLIRPCILAGCPEGGTVLEPFNGSGTTMMVAKQNRRHAIGIDGSEEYCRLAAPRIAQQVVALGPAQQWVQHEMAL